MQPKHHAAIISKILIPKAYKDLWSGRSSHKLRCVGRDLRTISTCHPARSASTAALTGGCTPIKPENKGPRHSATPPRPRGNPVPRLVAMIDCCGLERCKTRIYILHCIESEFLSSDLMVSVQCTFEFLARFQGHGAETTGQQQFCFGQAVKILRGWSRDCFQIDTYHISYLLSIIV